MAIFNSCTIEIQVKGESQPRVIPLLVDGSSIESIYVDDEKYVPESDFEFVELTTEHLDTRLGKVTRRYTLVDMDGEVVS